MSSIVKKYFIIIGSKYLDIYFNIVFFKHNFYISEETERVSLPVQTAVYRLKFIMDSIMTLQCHDWKKKQNTLASK